MMGWIDKYPRVKKVIEWISPTLFILFAFLLGTLWNIDKVSDECNEFIIDNYFTQDMQRCLLDQQRVFMLPNGSEYTVPDFNFNIGGES